MSSNKELVPSCLGDLSVIESVNEDGVNRKFSLSCTCGNGLLKLLGYSLKSQSSPEDDVFVGPLSVECPSCGKPSLFFDSEHHGYDGEYGASAAISGSGIPVNWKCPVCSGALFWVEVGFVYNVEPDDEFKFRSQDFFSEIAVICKCAQCMNSVVATSIDCI